MSEQPPAPPRILGLDHVGLAVRSFDDALLLYRDALGGVQVGRGAQARDGLTWLVLRYPNGSVLELIEPLGPDSPVERFLAERGPGVHHLTFIAESIRATSADLRARGYRVVGEDFGVATWQVAYVSPRSACGTVVQLAEGSEAMSLAVATPDALRERARALLAAASPAEQEPLRRFAAALGLLDDVAPGPLP